MSEPIITSLEGGLYTILLNNPSKHNCIGLEMLQQLKDAVDMAGREEQVRVVLIKGAGEKAFSTGANLKEFNALEGQEVEDWILLGHEIFDRLESLPQPTVAYIHGYAMGGGLELALSCDFRVATENALFSFPEVSHGWLPGWGGINRLQRLLGEAHAKRMILLSEPINGNRAYDIGLASKLLNNSELYDDDLKGFIDQLLSIDRSIYKLAKAAMRTTNGDARQDHSFDVLATYFAKQK